MKRNLKKSGTLALVAVVGLMAITEPAHASFLGIFGKKKKKKDDKVPATQPYAQPSAQPTPWPTPYPAPMPAPYPPAQQQQPTYQQQQPNYGTAPMQTTQIPASQTGTYGGGGYGRSNYGLLDAYVDYLRFAQPSYNYRPTPLNGPNYDPSPSAAYASPQVQALIAQALSQSYVNIGDATVQSSVVRNLYKLRGNGPAFVMDSGLTQQAVNAKTIFTQTVIKMGLDPRDYWAPEMEQRFTATDAKSLTELDLLLTQSYIALARHLNVGRAKSEMVDTSTLYKMREFTDYAALNNTLRPGSDMVAGLESLAPQHPIYKNLETSLAKFMQIQAAGGWPRLAGASVLKPGASSADVPGIRRRLAELGILPDYEASNTSSVYDSSLVAAVKKFQKNHKLGDDGVLGPAGFKVLNIPVEARINQIRATMDKWRVLPRTLGDRYIFVNIARQELEVVEYGQRVMGMDTINGKRLKPTPVMVDSMNSVVLNPYWNPPENNIREIVKTVKSDPNHLAEHNIKLYDRNDQVVDPSTINWNLYNNTIPPYRFREEPGPMNSLGVVKFNLAINTQAIYLHDTNVNHDPKLRGIFEKTDRYVSSGCIRVKNPLALLQYVLRDQPNYNSQRLDSILSYPDQNAAQTVKLTKAIPVYVVYGTVSFDDQGLIQFTNDSADYAQDKRIIDAMTPGKTVR